MGLTMITALVLQAGCLVVLRHRLGSTWLQRPMVLLVILATIYAGVSQILLAFDSIRTWDTYRLGIDQSYVDTATLVMAVALVGLTAGYLVVSRPLPDTKSVASALPMRWELAAAGCLPLAILTYEGRGLNRTTAVGPRDTPTQIAAAFFLCLTVLAAFGFLHRYGMRWFVPVLAVQSLAIAAAGERTPVVIAAIALVMSLARCGLKATRRQGVTVVVLVVLGIVGITGARAISGRELFTSDTSLPARATAVTDGISQILNPNAESGTGPGLVSQLAVRLDGSTMAGGIQQSIAPGTPRLGLAGIPESALLVVPRFIYPSKLDLPGLNPYLAARQRFGLAPVNFLPTALGIYYGFVGPIGLTVLMVLLGLVGGMAERRLLADVSPVRMAVFTAVVIALGRYEAGLPAIAIGLRTALVVGVFVWVLEAVRGWHRRADNHPHAGFGAIKVSTRSQE